MRKYFLLVLALHLALVPEENLGCALPSLIYKKLALENALGMGLCNGGAYAPPVLAPQPCFCSPKIKIGLGRMKLELLKQKLALKKLAALEALEGYGCGC